MSARRRVRGGVLVLRPTDRPGPADADGHRAEHREPGAQHVPGAARQLAVGGGGDVQESQGQPTTRRLPVRPRED